jgi:hypothetical protein
MWSLLAVKVGTLNTHGVCTISLQAAVHPLLGPHTTTTTTTVGLGMYYLQIRGHTCNVKKLTLDNLRLKEMTM